MTHKLHRPGMLNRRFHQRGQALAEFVIAAAAVLIPLFLLVPLLGKYQDMQATTIQAARYAAWERTVWIDNDDWSSSSKSDAAIQGEIKTRFFSDTVGNKLQSADSAPAGSSKPLWRDHAGVPILASYAGSTGHTQTPGTSDQILSMLVNIISPIDKVMGADGFKLDMSSLYTINASMQPANTSGISKAFTGANGGGFVLPRLTETNVVVSNGWSAKGPTAVKSQTESLALTSVFQRRPIISIMNVVQSGLGAFVEELQPDSLKLGGDIQVDRVPSDRVSGGLAPVVKPVHVSAVDRAAAMQTTQIDAGEKKKEDFKLVMNNFSSTENSIQSKINSCLGSKQNEMLANYWGTRHVDRTCSIWIFTYNCSYDLFYVKTPPGGPGSSYTPVSDADASCHASSLNPLISQLTQSYIESQIVKDSLAACAPASDGTSSAECTALRAKLQELDNRIAVLQNNASPLDTRFTTCSSLSASSCH